MVIQTLKNARYLHFIRSMIFVHFIIIKFQNLICVQLETCDQVLL